MKRLVLAAVLTASIAGAAAAQSGPSDTASATLQVTTLAGSGKPGFADGPAAEASFLMPTGLAYAGNGSLYVADEAAQRIRFVSSAGVVQTVAGSGAIGPDGLSVEGGFKDGPAAEARFNRPTSLALAKDGLYIGDSRNGCIRKLAAGVVSTAVGKCESPGSADGDAQHARIQDPRAMVVSANGTLYVADFGVGIRRVDRNGNVHTLAQRSTGERRFWGVAIGGEPDDPTLVGSSPRALVVWHLATGTDEVIDTGVAEGNRLFGVVGQLVGISRREFLFTDLRSSAVRYLRLPAKPFATTSYTRELAGGSAERAIDNAAFADGPLGTARFYAPYGIAVDGKTAYVADTGNRRIRRVDLPNFRLSESGFADQAPYDSGHYQIVYLGASWAYWDSLGDDSICAQLESHLDRARRFSKPVRCHPVRIDAASFPQMEDYIANYLQGHIDLLVINTNIPEAYSIFPGSNPPNLHAAAAAFKAHVTRLVAHLNAGNTKLLFIWAWDPEDISDAENLLERQDNTSRRFLPVNLRDQHGIVAKALEDAVAPLGVYQYDTYDDFQRYEREQGSPPLYGTDDSHMTIAGASLMANLLSNYIIGEKSF